MKINSYKTFTFLWIVGFVFTVSSVFSQNKLAVTEFKLDNGLTVILHEDHSIPEVFGVVIVKAGSKNDPADATGMAHYQEHMLFKGTQELGTTDWSKEKPYIDKIFELYDKLGQTTDEEERKKIQKEINEQSISAGEYAIPNELDKTLKSIGGRDMNAGTAMDYTLFYNSFPPNQMDKWLELYSHRFISPVFRLFQAELEVVYEEKNLYNDIFITSIFENFSKNFFKKHPYGQQTTIGTVESLKNPSLTKMYNFFKTYYVANNMALVLSGDFNTNDVIPLIKDKFSKWQSGKVPEFPKYEETDFSGREEVVMKLSPIKIGLFGFRTPPVNSQEQYSIEVCNRILSNENQTGLLDKLMLDNKLLAAQVFSLPYNDYGSTLILAIPKIIGQSLEEAEKLIMDEIHKLGNGEFDDQMVENLKLEILKEYEQSLESNEQKAVTIAQSFAQNISVDEMNNVPERIKSITKQDIVGIAKKYYGNNYLAFYSKMGFPKKDKLDKPEYKPITPKKDAVSPFAEKFDQIKEEAPVEKYVDFNNDFICKEIAENVTLYSVKNVDNDIFNLKIKFGKGKYLNPRLNYAAQILNYAGTVSKSLNEYKTEFSKLGSSYSISADDSYLVVDISGFDKQLLPTLALLKEVFESPKIEENKLQIIVSGEQSARKLEHSEPDNVAKALFSFVKFGNNSEYIHRLSLKEIRALKIDTLIADFKDACKYNVGIHYSGNAVFDELNKGILDFLSFNKTFIKGNSPVVLDQKSYSENSVYFVHRKNSLQSKIYLFVNGEPYSKEQDPYIKGFNQYFSGDFSGLVLQEIREYRSMAYSAAAYYSIAPVAGKKSSFMGYVGTQDDKTIDAIDVFTGLVKDMPLKPDRMENIKSFLIQSELTNYPSFRNLTETVSAWKLRGYNSDPAKINIEVLKKMDFNKILDFYKKSIQPKPIIYSVVGDKKRVDQKQLEKYGKIIYIKENELFK